jgi:hypothetical protein
MDDADVPDKLDFCIGPSGCLDRNYGLPANLVCHGLVAATRQESAEHHSSRRGKTHTWHRRDSIPDPFLCKDWHLK